MNDQDPIILTLGFDPASFQRLNALRQAYFPAALNFIPAHLTLFHHLPGRLGDRVTAEVARAAADCPAFEVEVWGLRKLGRGVALTIDSPDLQALRGRLAHAFSDLLTPQDRQGFRPHVTIQNKVDPKIANALFDRLSADFQPWKARAEALLLWHYRGGPWEPMGRHDLVSIGG